MIEVDLTIDPTWFVVDSEPAEIGAVDGPSSSSCTFSLLRDGSPRPNGRLVGQPGEVAPSLSLGKPPLPEPRVMAAQAIDAVKVYRQGDIVVRALDGVTVGFVRGQFTAIMGPSGSGKSTLMHCLAGLDRLTSGRIMVGGTNVSTLGHKGLTTLRRDRIGFVFQAFNLVPTLTALENITLPLALAGRQPDPAWLDQVVQAVGLAGRLAHKPAQLSGGQQQRVASARALVTRPDIVFADEPTGNLDSAASAEVLSFMRRSVTEMGQTVVLVTHDPVAAGYADRVVFLADGRVVDEVTDPTSQWARVQMAGHGG
jgi:putative ABC transport system ATP-binding protein